MLSAFNYCRGWSSGGDENQRFRDKLLEFDCFDSFVASDVYLDHFGPDKMFQPQSAWILGKDGEPLIDFIGKLESINQWVPDILTKFQIPAEEAKRLEKLNSSQSDPRLGLQTLCETSINKIVELYKQDFELFDYSPNLIAALGDVNLQEVTQD
jgi:hypothetical protein